MNISDVKTSKKVGDFELRKDNNPNRIKLNYHTGELSSAELVENTPRVYLFVSEGEIKKIGGSASRGGIKATMSFYINAMQGSPGRPRFIIHRLIEEELKLNKKVELYIITSPRVKAKVAGLFGYEEVEVASFKEMEDKCKKDYFEREKRYPDWNFQENSESYPKEIEEEFMSYHNNRLHH
jgi:hypothetical protein